MFRPIYEPRTRAREYCDLAVNIYTGCPHGCTYCYARAMAKRFGRPWGDTVRPRHGIVEAMRLQLAGMQGQGKKIMLCFTCDPYPMGHDSTATRDVIKAIKESGNHVQILTKGNFEAQRDFDLLDKYDSFGVTLTGGWIEHEPNSGWEITREHNLQIAHGVGIPTWVSCEPIFNPCAILGAIKRISFVGIWRIGKLNHQKSNINWQQFGHDVEELCKRLGRNYYIKEDLRREMEVKQ